MNVFSSETIAALVDARARRAQSGLARHTSCSK